MTEGYLQWLRDRGIACSSPRDFPINFICFRQHPCPHLDGIEMYRQMIREGRAIEPIVVCNKCYVVLDGWHRLAAHWLEGKRIIRVVLANYHWYGKDYCNVSETPYLDKVDGWAGLDVISCSYHKKDWDNQTISQMKDELISFGDKKPLQRLWEHSRTAIVLGNVRGRKILDVGTRDSILPNYFASRGATVYSIDTNIEFFPKDERYPVIVQQADARALPFEDCYFDDVTCTACLKTIPGWGDREAVREMARVLKPGGLLAISVDYWKEYRAYPTNITGYRIYDEGSLYRRIINPSGLSLVYPVDFNRCEWDAPKDEWPIKQQAYSVWQKGVNLQVAFILLAKE